ncbi:MAG: hypothetical protein HZA07_04790 [Nitrospirae bacterium]|nr:hypothetical protein [Nitrospirota bacterium]
MLSGESLNYKNILDEIRTIYKENYQEDNIDIIEVVFNDVIDLFSGKRRGVRKCDTIYHNLLHTLQIIPPFIKIIDGWNKSGNAPKISREFFDMGIIAVLFHDTGYIKTEDDVNGTGAKYTFIHIQRSTDFAGHYLSEIGFEEHKISSIKNMIMCTGVKVDYNRILFNSEEERIVGYALGTADLLGQMSAVDYPEKLPILYREFEEAYRYEGIERLREKGMAVFESVDDLIRKTPYFYEVVVMGRVKDMGSIYKYLTYHFKDSKNHYIEAIEENIKRIRLASVPQ